MFYLIHNISFYGDASLFMGRSFRVGWGPNWTLLHCTSPQVGSSEDEEDISDSPRDASRYNMFSSKDP